MSARARAWLAERAADVPPSLAARLTRALDDVADRDGLPAHLTAAARACLRDALADPDSREAALHLLAADALITYACEAAAGEDDGALRELAADWSPERLTDLTDETDA